MSTSSPTLANTEQHRLVRRRVFTVSHPTYTVISEVLTAIHAEHATGKLTINISQGTPNTIQFEEEQRVSATP